MAGATQISSVDGMVMVYVPAGKFKMGSEEAYADEQPMHTVYLDSFLIDQTEVVFSQFQTFMQTMNYVGYPCGFGDHPVACVNWYDAQAYCEWAGRRLPTEAEWEKAARGGLEGVKYPWGNIFDGSKANYCDKNCKNYQVRDDEYDDKYEETAPVGSYEPNGYSLYDMAGNVWEWVADIYNNNYYVDSPSNNPEGPASGYYRAMRGGSWRNYSVNLRVSDRRGYDPIATRSIAIGFRCAMDTVP